VDTAQAVSNRIFVIDTDVFIQSKNMFYSFDVCPGFWKSLIECNGNKEVESIDWVKNEILDNNYGDDLQDWVKTEAPEKFFVITKNDDAVTKKYAEIIKWVQAQPQYFKEAKAEFASGADGWLIAYAAIHGRIVVTQEKSRPESKKKVPIPNVCEAFGVVCRDVFEMLAELNVRLVTLSGS
jgi:hypothetical protein